MFNSLTGIITEKNINTVCIDTHGIEWLVNVPTSSIDVLPVVGSEARIFTHMTHSENDMTLYGFASATERAFFFDLIKVDGIGPKGAVKIMSSVATAQIVAALDGGDVAVLEKIPGVGKKTAAKMMLALKGKLTIPSENGTASGRGGSRSASGGKYEAVIVSLSSMGYDRRDCDEVVAKIAAEIDADENMKTKKPTEREDAIFRRALVELAS